MAGFSKAVHFCPDSLKLLGTIPYLKKKGGGEAEVGSLQFMALFYLVWVIKHGFAHYG
jgi:hypothetical protein